MQEQRTVVPKLADAGFEQREDVAGAHQNAGVPAVKIRLHIGGVIRGFVLRIVHQPGRRGTQRIARHSGGTLSVVAHFLESDGNGSGLHAEFLQRCGINLVQGQCVHDAGGVRVLENGRRRARIHTVVPGLFAPPDAVGFAGNSATSPTQLMRIQETSFISSRVYGKSRSPELKAVRPMMRDRLPSIIRSTAAPTEARVMRMRRIKRNVRMCFR